jgi:predicted secreted acid phosphatase
VGRKFLYANFSILLILSLAGCQTNLPNLAEVKHSYIVYHDSGRYYADLARVDNEALQYLQSRVQHKLPHEKLAIVLDIDETSLSNYPDMLRFGFGGSIAEINAAEGRGRDDAILPTLQIFRYAKAHDIAVFFITGRYTNEKQGTVRNLRMVGFNNFDGIALKPLDYHEPSVVPYKSSARKAIAEQGYIIVLNIGDQESDLAGGYAEKTFKLSNPYYFIR